jgi:hypothetical protein
MSKDAYYFSHDSNARNDEKMLSLRMKLGMEGCGVYWCIIEMLRDSTDYRMRMQCERIAFELHTKKEIVKSVISDFELFNNDNNYFWSESLLRRMEIKEKKSQKARESAKARWEKADAMRTHSDSNASKGKESKKNKRKESKVLEVIFPFNSKKFKEQWQFWKDYKKDEFSFKYKTIQSEQAALKKLADLSENNENSAIEIIHQSFANGWKGFFKIKNDINGKQGFTKAYDKHLRETDPNYHNY